MVHSVCIGRSMGRTRRFETGRALFGLLRSVKGAPDCEQRENWIGITRLYSNQGWSRPVAAASSCSVAVIRSARIFALN